MLSKMISIAILLLLFDQSASVKMLNYTYRIDGYNRGDSFGHSMDTHNTRLVIGAPGDQSVTIEKIEGEKIKGEKIKGPGSFGYTAAVNQKYLVVGNHDQLFVHMSTSPYTLMNTLPGRSTIRSLDMSNDHTIVYAADHRLPDVWLTHVTVVYVLDHNKGSWTNSYKEAKEGRITTSVSIYNDDIAIGYVYYGFSFVQMLSRKEGHWQWTQTIEPSVRCQIFGLSLMVEDKQMVVNSNSGNVFVYKRQANSTVWGNEVKIGDQWKGDGYSKFPAVAIKGDMVAATNNNDGTVLYKRVDEKWSKYAVLKAEKSGEDEWFNSVRIEDNVVFTSRSSSDDVPYSGAVFVHKLE